MQVDWKVLKLFLLYRYVSRRPIVYLLCNYWSMFLQAMMNKVVCKRNCVEDEEGKRKRYASAVYHDTGDCQTGNV